MLTSSRSDKDNVCLFSLFVTDTGVDTTQVSSVLATLIRRRTPTYMFVREDILDPSYTFQMEVRGKYEDMQRLLQERGLVSLCQVGRYRQRDDRKGHYSTMVL